MLDVVARLYQDGAVSMSPDPNIEDIHGVPILGSTDEIWKMPATPEIRQTLSDVTERG